MTYRAADFESNNSDLKADDIAFRKKWCEQQVSLIGEVWCSDGGGFMKASDNKAVDWVNSQNRSKSAFEKRMDILIYGAVHASADLQKDIYERVRLIVR